MALRKDYNYKGITANYWKITNANWDGFINTMYIELSLYLNESSRNNNVNDVLITKSFIFSNMAEVSREELYENIKNIETDELGNQKNNSGYKFFNNSIDV